MKTLPILCVENVSGTAKSLTNVFGWKTTHGGDEFEELIHSNSERMLWLHQLDAPEHARFAENHKGNLGRGMALYVFVPDIEATLARLEALNWPVVEPLAPNPSAGFREFTFREPNGYHFTVAEQIAD